MRETDLLQHIIERSRRLSELGPDAGVVVGPGDDCAVLAASNGGRLLATVDQLVEGRHYDSATAPTRLIARKAMARAVSDIAAMGGRPRWAMAAACLPEGYRHADELFDHMAEWAMRFECPLVGGDIAASPPGSPLVLSVTALGEALKGRRAITRSGARPGDVLLVTGRIGGSFTSGRHMTFNPRIREALWLTEELGESLHAMIDISDGLGRDAGRIAGASRVRIELNPTAIPLNEDASDWRAALGDGEDYELLCAVAPEKASGLPPMIPGTLTPVSPIGRVLSAASPCDLGCFVPLEKGGWERADEYGWDHRT